MKPLIIKCYAIKKGGVFFAASITLNLTATGATFEEARNNLNNLIIDYLNTISHNRKLEEFEHLLNRPAPAYMYFEFALCFIACALRKNTEACNFNEQVPYNIQFAH